MREVTLQAFAAAQADGAVVLDVREPGEYVGGHVPGAALVPLAQLPGRLSEVPKGVPVYVICASGNRSLSATDFLLRHGFEAWSVAGGTGGWIRSGHPVVTGSRPDAA